jgi:DNA (cytosine-5)-methyltransferase 1
MEFRYLDLFSGYGGFSLGIQQAYELSEVGTKSENSSDSESGAPQHSECPLCIGFSEIDKYAIQTYNKNFKYEECENCRLARERECHSRTQERQETLNSGGTCLSQNDRHSNDTDISSSAKNNCQCRHKNYGDIKSINASELPDFDLLCGGFPCQVFSIAGKRAGFEDTRGTLIYDVFRIIKEKHPKLVLLENVKGLLSHDCGRTFKTIITSLAELGYAVEWQVLNAKNFGVPQNRERVFIIGHLGGFGGRQVFPITQNNSEDIVLPTITTRITADSNGTYVRKRQTYQTTESGGQDNGHRESESNNSNSRWREEHPADFRIRRLTPTECERLMGLPDGWTEGVSDTQRYKLCGNGVVVNVVKEIMIRLIKNYGT